MKMGGMKLLVVVVLAYWLRFVLGMPRLLGMLSRWF